MKKLFQITLLLILFSLVAATSFAQDPVTNEDNQNNVDNPEEKSCEVFNPAMYETSDRAPLRDAILSHIGGLKGKSVIDIGAGAGYFGFEYAKYADQVYVTELDERLLSYMNEKKTELSLKNVHVIRGSNTFSELSDLSLDFAIMVDVYHELKNPKNMLPVLKSALNEDGKVIIAESHISSTIVTDYLEMTGFKNISVTDFSYQTNCGPSSVYIIEGVKLAVSQ